MSDGLYGTDRKKAVALRYEANQGTPTTVAKGNGAVAESIIRIAKEHAVFVHQSPELVSLLMQLDLDEKIPESLYVVVAELLAWVYAIDSAQGTVPSTPAAGG